MANGMGIISALLVLSMLCLVVQPAASASEGRKLLGKPILCDGTAAKPCVGTEAKDTLNLTLGTTGTSMTGLGGSDTIQGNTGDDTLLGGEGSDNLRGMEGNDNLDGGNGDDTLAGMFGNDQLDGGPGADTLIGGYGVDTIIGGPNDDDIDSLDNDADSVFPGTNGGESGDTISGDGKDTVTLPAELGPYTKQPSDDGEYEFVYVSSVDATQRYYVKGVTNVVATLVTDAPTPTDPPVTDAPTPPPSTPSTGGNGDPHFTGFDGSQFDVSGVHNAFYNLVSEQDHSINAQFGNVGDILVHNLWMTQIGAVLGKDATIAVRLNLDNYVPKYNNVYEDANRMSRMLYDDIKSIITVEINGKDVTDMLKSDKDMEVIDNLMVFFPSAMHSEQDPTDGPLVVFRTNKLEVSVLLETEGVLHLDFGLQLLGGVGMDMHGIVGQTLHWTKSANGFEGDEEDYVVSDLLSTECKFNRYNKPVRAIRSRMLGAQRRPIFAVAGSADFVSSAVGSRL